MKQGFLRSSRYSPGNMSRESLETLFVGRTALMEDVLSRVTASIQSSMKHYILLVGPRGSGKTHFLALAYHRLMDRLAKADARDSVAVAVLKEEEWGVVSFLDLVIRILGALADRLPEIRAEIDEIYDRFSKDPVHAEAFAVARLRHRTRGKTLLLLCENLADLFDGLGEEGQKRWRATIQEDGNWAIVASTPSLFPAVTMQDSPFYGFFTVRPLKKIDFEAGLDLLARKAAHERKAELEEFLHTPVGRARVRAAHHLAAGNHRTYVILFDFLDKERLDDLVLPFMEMVDDLTPYYRDLMRQLPPVQRKIVEFLCRQGLPRKIKDIARSCLMSHQTAAKQVGELQRAGFISKTCIGRNTYCELSEPLMRICIEVKGNKPQYFRLFVEFLRRWFTNDELEQSHVAFQARDIDAESQHAQKLRDDILCCETPFHALETSGVSFKTIWEREAQTAAATEPLADVLDRLVLPDPEDFESSKERYVDTIARMLTTSMYNCGPRHLPQGVVKLRQQWTDQLGGDVVGPVLTNFLKANVGSGFAGSLTDWERALSSITDSLADLADCRIPIGMLQVAVKYTKTGKKRHLLGLPIEQRRLLDSILPSTAGERAD